MKEVQIKDHALCMALKEIGLRIPFTHESLQDITELEWTEYMEETNVLWIPIHELDGIQNCRNLICLYLTGNKIRDLSPLEKLENLEELYLGNNPFESLEPIKKLKKLKILNLIGSGALKDLSPLTGLDCLEEIHLSKVEGNREVIEKLAGRCKVVETRGG